MVEVTNTSSHFGNVFEILNNLGFFNIILPMVLIYAIVLGVLEKTEIFKTTPSGGTKQVVNKNVNAAVAFSIALLSVASANIVGTITELTSYFVIFIFVIIYALLLLTTIDLGSGNGTKIIDSQRFKTSAFIVVLIVILAIIAFTVKVNDKLLIDHVFSGIFSTTGTTTLIVLGFIAVVFIIYKRPGFIYKK